MSYRPLGLIDRDSPDERDLLLGARVAVPADYQPQSEQLANLAFVRRNRDQIGSSCVGNGVANAIEVNSARHGLPDVALSEQHIYTLARLSHLPAGSELDDTGTYIRPALDAFRRRGCAHRTAWPGMAARINERPPLRLQLEGLHEAKGSYWRLTGGGDAMQLHREVCFALDHYGEVVTGKLIGSAYEALIGRAVLPPPAKGEVALGGHCTVYSGYIDGGRTLIERGSWGSSWGYSDHVVGSDGVGRHVSCLGLVDAEWLAHPWVMDVWAWIPEAALPREATP